jgi:heat shock protein HslJ
MDRSDIELDGTRWRATVVAGMPSEAHVQSTIEFDDGHVFGRGGVNTFRGGCELVGDQLTFGPLATTLMAGPEEAMDQEYRWLQSLGGPVTVAFDGGELTLTHPDGTTSRLVPLEAETDQDAGND